jgi:hypothetical protein
VNITNLIFFVPIAVVKNAIKWLNLGNGFSPSKYIMFNALIYYNLLIHFTFLSWTTSIVKVVALSASKGDQRYCGRAQGNKNQL